MSLETGASLKEVVDKAEQIDADLQNKKQLIATAVTGKDVPTNGSDSFQKMAENIDSIKTKLPILEGDVGVTEDPEGNVYRVVNYEYRHAYDNEKVSLLWNNKLHTDSISAIAIDSFGCIYIGSLSSGLRKISPDGKLIWEQRAPSYVRKIVRGEDGYIYVGVLEKKIYVYTPEGELISTYYTTFQIHSIDVRQQMIYVSGNKNARIYNATTGVEIGGWSGGGYNYTAIVADSEGNAYFGGDDEQLRKISTSGSLIWTKANSGSTSSMVIDDQDYIYIAEVETYKLNKNGDVIRKFNNSYTQIAIYEDYYLYGIKSSNLFKEAPEGYEIWKYEGLGASGDIKVDNNKNIYCASGSASYNAYNLAKIKDNYKIQKLAVLKERGGN